MIKLDITPTQVHAYAISHRVSLAEAFLMIAAEITLVQVEEGKLEKSDAKKSSGVVYYSVVDYRATETTG